MAIRTKNKYLADFFNSGLFKFFEGLFNFLVPPAGAAVDFIIQRTNENALLKRKSPLGFWTNLNLKYINVFAFVGSAIAVSFMATSFVPGNLMGISAGQKLLQAMNLPLPAVGGLPGLSLFVAIVATAVVGCAVRALVNLLSSIPGAITIYNTTKSLPPQGDHTSPGYKAAKVMGKAFAAGFVGAPIEDRLFKLDDWSDAAQSTHAREDAAETSRYILVEHNTPSPQAQDKEEEDMGAPSTRQDSSDEESPPPPADSQSTSHTFQSTDARFMAGTHADLQKAAANLQQHGGEKPKEQPAAAHASSSQQNPEDEDLSADDAILDVDPANDGNTPG